MPDYSHLTDAQLDELIAIKELNQKEDCESSLAEFTKAAWSIIDPEVLKWNWHLDTICGYLEAFRRGELPDKRIIFNIGPGYMKSILISVMYPAWCWISEPGERFLSVSCAADLATRDSVKMKLVVTSPWYQKNWPLILSKDQNEKTLFSNDKLGFRQAIGVSASTTGKRGSTLLLDDLIDAKEAFSDVVRKSVNDAWDQALASRLNDPVNSGIILIMQRLHEDDITGHLLKKVKSHWTHVCIPTVYEGFSRFDAGKDIGRPDLNDPRKKKGELLHPSRVPQKAIDEAKETLGDYGFAGQHQQRPVPLGGGIIKKHDWRRWPDDKPLPRAQYTFTSWDTAFGENDQKNNACSAATRWGVFWHKERERYCVMLLGRWFDRVEYTGLRAKFDEWDRKWTVDMHLVEAKSTGITLIGDLKDVATKGLVKSYCPGKGEDKYSRAFSVTPLFQMGLIYVPPKAWAEEVIDFVASFPNGSPPSADLTDTVTAALIYLRKGRWFENTTDETLETERTEREKYRKELEYERD
jgi:phage terminase large subunit-like protein